MIDAHSNEGGGRDRYSNGQAPFRVPPELARRWGSRNTPVRGQIRRFRRRARHTARAGVRRLSEREARRRPS